MYFFEAVRASIKKALYYRANLVSWFLADIALYAGTFLAYYLLTDSVSDFGGYTSKEMLLYISTFSLVNNLYSIFFAESASAFGSAVLLGRLDFFLLKPRALLKSFIYMNLNVPAVCATPFLIFVNIYLVSLCGVQITGAYILSIIFATIVMGLMFFAIYSLTLFGLRAEAISNIALQLLLAAEKPDTVFPKIARNLLIYVVPVFVFSAFPTRTVLGRITSTEIVWGWVSPILYFAVTVMLIRRGRHKYQSGVE